MDKLFWDKVKKTDTCWLWTGSVKPAGYGQVRRRGHTLYAHRVSWESQRGEIKKGLVLDHKCRNRACVNPEHLRLVTRSINSSQNVVGAGWQLNAQKTHCKRGHAFVGENIYLTPSTGARQCQACRRLRGNNG